MQKMIKEALIIFSTVLIAVLIAYSLGYIWYIQANVQERTKMANYFKDKDLNFFFDSLKEIASTQIKQQFRFGHNDYYEDQKK